MSKSPFKECVYNHYIHEVTNRGKYQVIVLALHENLKYNHIVFVSKRSPNYKYRPFSYIMTYVVSSPSNVLLLNANAKYSIHPSIFY